MPAGAGEDVRVQHSHRKVGNAKTEGMAHTLCLRRVGNERVVRARGGECNVSDVQICRHCVEEIELLILGEANFERILQST